MPDRHGSIHLENLRSPQRKAEAFAYTDKQEELLQTFAGNPAR